MVCASSLIPSAYFLMERQISSCEIKCHVNFEEGMKTEDICCSNQSQRPTKMDNDCCQTSVALITKEPDK